MASTSSRREILRSWRRVTLRGQAILILALAIGPMLVSLLMLGFSTQRDITLDREIAQHRDARGLETEAEKLLVDAETGVRGFLLTGDAAFLEPYQRARVEAGDVFDELEGNHEEAGGEFESARVFAESELRTLAYLVEGGGAIRQRLLDGKIIMDDFRAEMNVRLQGGAAREAAVITILQVEDNPTNIRLMERILGRQPNVELVTVTRGDEAVTAAKRSRPAIILLDVNLPDISGREVLARLRAEAETSNIPVVMLSADASPNQIERLRASGAAAYVTKPLDINHFTSVMDDLLHRAKAS